MILIAIIIILILGIVISYNMYVQNCFDSFFKAVLNYIYFPSTIAYFFIILFVTIMLIYSIYSKKLTKVKTNNEIRLSPILYKGSFFFRHILFIDDSTAKIMTLILFAPTFNRYKCYSVIDFNLANLSSLSAFIFSYL